VPRSCSTRLRRGGWTGRADRRTGGSVVFECLQRYFAGSRVHAGRIARQRSRVVDLLPPPGPRTPTRLSAAVPDRLVCETSISSASERCCVEPLAASARDHCLAVPAWWDKHATVAQTRLARSPLVWPFPRRLDLPLGPQLLDDLGHRDRAPASILAPTCRPTELKSTWRTEGVDGGTQPGDESVETA
jgi:hypothetical protein